MASIAEDIIADARQLTGETLANAQSNMNFGMITLNSLRPAGTATFQFKNEVLIPGPIGTPPQFGGSAFADPGFSGTAPTLRDVGDLALPPDVGAAPTPLTYNAPDKPEGEPSTEIIGPLPDMLEFPDIPDMPDLLTEIRGIQRPPLVDIELPPDPEMREPAFDGVRPTTPTPPPTNLDQTYRAVYAELGPVMRDAVEAHFDAILDNEFPEHRSQIAAIEAKLTTYLAGGTALTADVLNDIRSRAEEKTDTEFRRASEQAYGTAARAGQTMIGPSIASMQRDIDMERRQALNRVDIEIAIKQAELEQQNMQFAMTLSVNLRQVAIGFISNYIGQLVVLNGQAMEAARNIVDAIVKAFEIAAKYSEVQARIYEADARVYEARLRQAMAAVEFYTAKIRGLEAKANVNTAQVNAYKALLEGVKAEADVYTAAINGLRGFADVERLKVDILQARTNVYVAQVNASSARWTGYRAAVEGETSRQQVSVQQLRAYQAQVEANNSIIEGRTKQIEARSRSNEQAIRVYETQARVYDTIVGAKAKVAAAEVLSFDTTVKAFMGGAEATNQRSQAQVAAFRAATEALTQQANVALANLREANAIEVAKITGIARVATAAGAVHGNVAQAIGSGMNTLAAQITQTTS